MHDRYYLELAAAYIRGKLKKGNDNKALFSKQLKDLSLEEQEQLFELGYDQGLRLHKFKRTMELPRVHRVLGVLKGLCPENLLDIGTGHGVFLWPLLAEFSDLEVSCIDIRPDRYEDLMHVRSGGIERLSPHNLDACSLSFPDGSFDVVTVLEVLEHMPQAQKALNEAVRVCRRNVIISVPSSEDDNPEHIHVLDKKRLKEMMAEAGARARFQGVRNHIVVVGTKVQ